MKYIAKLKSKKRLPYELPKLPKAPYDGFDSTDGKHPAENVSPKPLPYLEIDGTLIIPFASDHRYHWWQGGLTVQETLKEFGDREGDTKPICVS